MRSFNFSREVSNMKVTEVGIAFSSMVPTWVFDEIDDPKARGEGRNNQMVRIGPELIRHGATEDDLRRVFHRMYDQLGDEQEREIEKVCRNCTRLAAISEKMGVT